MPTRYSKEVLKEVERLGFEYLWSNHHGHHCFVYPDDPQQTEFSVNPSINNEHAARAKIRDARKIVGLAPVIVKRHGSQINERLAAERERAERQLEWAERKRQLVLAEQREQEQIRRVEELVEARRSQLLAIHRQMAQAPQGSQHVGRGRVERIGTATDGTPL